MIQKITISLVNLILNQDIKEIPVQVKFKKNLKLKELKEIPVQVKVKNEQKLDHKKILGNQEKLKDNKIVTVKTKKRDNKIPQRQEPNQLNLFVIGTEVLYKFLIFNHIVILFLIFFIRHLCLCKI